MKKIIIFLLATLVFATSNDLKEIKSDIKLILYKVSNLEKRVDRIEKKVDEMDKKLNDLDKRVYANTLKIEALEKNMNKRFEDMNKRFEDINKRFEDMNKRFEDINKRFEDMLNYLWMISAAFLGLTGVAIGFAVWDRKSTIKATKEEIVEEIKTKKLKEFIFELQKLSKKDAELARVLKSFHLL